MGWLDSLIAAMVVFLILDGVAVAARVYVRTKMQTRGFGIDDIALCLTYTGYMIACGFGFAAMYYGYAAEDHRPYYNPAKSTQYLFACQLAIYISSGLVKIAVALVVYRIAVQKSLRWLLIGSMVVVAIWTIITTIYSSYLCATGGTSNYAGSETCTRVGYFRTITNIFIDYFYALLPAFMLRKVQMKLRLKLIVVFLLGLGVFASSTTIVKLVVIIRLTHASKAEAEGLHYQLLLWAVIELGLAIFAASLAALRPLLRHLPAFWNMSRTPKSNASDAVGPYHELALASEMGRSSTKTGGASRLSKNTHELSVVRSVSRGDEVHVAAASDDALV
ncbi:Uu.00g009620.m01.CDS01 [Anthostomella pinea]|uniref:Uu.00g009620.m01.CDS01 n=1 Tax=Anthostomella pinea TaxID=933095 RepID=A0AAI8YPY2_9PEZI|nr:Uu.00g009620.m01.CDS01 [Anthostomella pinea]